MKISVRTALSIEVARAFYGDFRELRAAQRDSVEPILRGRDVLILSGTGSGKTEAVLAPLVDRHLRSIRVAAGCSILYIVPTRALANDLLRRLETPLERLGVLIGIRHGERNDLARSDKPDVLITTPESLDVLLVSREPALADVRAVVIDEIHLTYNTQRGFQLGVLIERLKAAVKHELQICGLSATVAHSEDIWRFFRPEREYTCVQADQGKPIDYVIRRASSPGQIRELLNKVGERPEAKVLLFANARRECDELAAALRSQTAFGDNVFVHHSSLSRDMRLETERAFQEAGRAVCIATSTLELGIDIGDIDLVMLYGHPGGWESFLQRLGRGNRRGTKSNVACLIPKADETWFATALAFEALMEQVRSGRLEREAPGVLYGAAAQQMLSMIAESDGAYRRVAELAEPFSHWPHLSRAEIERTLAGLEEEGYVRRHGYQNRYGAGEGLHRLRGLRLLWSNLPVRSRDVRLTSSGRELGQVSASNLLRIEAGDTVRFAARTWRVRRVTPDEIQVEPSGGSSGLELAYRGPKMPMDPSLLEEMLRLLDSGIESPALPPEDARTFQAVVARLRLYVGWSRIPVARTPTGFHYFTFAGETVNGTLARWAQTSSFDAGEIVLRTDEPLDFASIPTRPIDLRTYASEAMNTPGNLSIFQTILPAELLERELTEAWLTTPVFARSLKRLAEAGVIEVPLTDMTELAL